MPTGAVNKEALKAARKAVLNDTMRQALYDQPESSFHASLRRVQRALEKYNEVA